jgi:hypothetical protein
MLNHGANDGIFNLAVVQIDADFVADLEFAWLLWILGHGEQCTSFAAGRQYAREVGEGRWHPVRSRFRTAKCHRAV